MTHGRFSAGFTLVEMMISVVISAFVIASIVALAIISSQNFASTANYVNMDDQSRYALDRISREIRNATALCATNANYLVLTNANKGTTATILFTNSSIVLKKTSQQDKTLLTGCDSFKFQLLNREAWITTNNNNINITFYAATNPATGNLDMNYCKVIDLSWKCSRRIIGSKLSTEVVQTAQVVLRNQQISP